MKDCYQVLSIESVVGKAEKHLKKLFPQGVPRDVAERFREELESGGSESVLRLRMGYLVIAERLSDLAREYGFPLWYRGTFPGMLICYLAGMTQINPLPAKYGGIDIPFVGEWQHPGQLDVSCVPAFLPYAIECLRRTENADVDSVAPHSCCRGSIVELSVRVGKEQDHYRVLLLPSFRLGKIADNCSALGEPFKNVLNTSDSIVPEIIGLMEQGRLMRYDIPDHQPLEAILRVISPKTFAELVEVLALSMQRGGGGEPIDQLERDYNGRWDIPDTREDVYLRITENGDLDKEEAVSMIKDFGQRRVWKPIYEQMLRRAGMTEAFIERCKKMEYLYPKAQCAEVAHMICEAAYIENALMRMEESQKCGDKVTDNLCKGGEIMKEEIRDNQPEVRENGKKRFGDWLKEHKTPILMAGGACFTVAMCILGARIKVKGGDTFSPIDPEPTPVPNDEMLLDRLFEVRDPLTRAPHDVSEHIRNLPKGWSASEDKRWEAISKGIGLEPWQTIVDSYRTGEI